MTTHPDHDHPDARDWSSAVIGAALLAPRLIPEILETGLVTDDLHPTLWATWDAICGLWAEGSPCDPITVARRIGGGPASDLRVHMDAVPTAANGAYYAGLLHEAGQMRRFRTRLMQAASAGSLDDALALTQDAVAAAATGVGDSLRLIGDVDPEIPDPADPETATTTRVFTGLAELDELTGGLPGFGVVAAGSGVGKSSFARGIAEYMAGTRNVPTALFSLEMSSPEIKRAMLAAAGSVPLRSIRSGELAAGERLQVDQAAAYLRGLPLWLDDTASASFAHVAAKARLLHAAHGLGLVIIDYLQLMSSGRRVESRQVEVAEFSRQCKLLSKDLGIPVIALSQFNRQAAQREGGRGTAQDLRESGSLEHDADWIILIDRDDVDGEVRARPGEADIRLVKHRSGQPGQVTVVWQGTYSRFVDFGGV